MDDALTMEEVGVGEIPGLDADVFFGDPDNDLPDWRETLESHDDDSDELTPEEREAVIGMIGFDPAELEKKEDAPALQVKPSPFRSKSLEGWLSKAAKPAEKKPSAAQGQPCKRGQSAARTGCIPKSKQSVAKKPTPKKETTPKIEKKPTSKPSSGPSVKPAVVKPSPVAKKPKLSVSEMETKSRSLYDDFAKARLGGKEEKQSLQELRDILSQMSKMAIERFGHITRVNPYGNKGEMISQIIHRLEIAKRMRKKGPPKYNINNVVAPPPGKFNTSQDAVSYLASLHRKMEVVNKTKEKLEKLTKNMVGFVAGGKEKDQRLQMYEHRRKFLDQVTEDFNSKVRDYFLDALAVDAWSPSAIEPSAFMARMDELFKSTRPRYDSKKTQEKFAPALDFLKRAVSKSVAADFQIDEALNGRASYNHRSKKVNIDFRMSDAATLVHEVGHHLEHNVPGLAERALEFVKKRCANTPSRKLKDVFPGSGYGSDEIGNQDDFAKTFGKSGWYVGKTYDKDDMNVPVQKLIDTFTKLDAAYPDDYNKEKIKELKAKLLKTDSTEIISMGVEKLYSDPAGFAKNDPEYCAMIVDALRGKVSRDAAVSDDYKLPEIVDDDDGDVIDLADFE